MILGHFLKAIAEKAPQAISEATPGTPVVAASNMKELSETGLPAILRFGIVSAPGRIICRRCVSGDIDSASFCVEELASEDFLADGCRLYPCEGAPSATGDPLARAQARLGEQTKALLSYTGDDFVAECLTGETTEELLRRSPNAGQHWCTPFRITPKEVFTLINHYSPMSIDEKKFISTLEKYVPNFSGMSLLDQTHHGIAIEAEQVIHFSSCRLSEDVARIKTDSIENFMLWRTGTREGGPVVYKEETPAQRLTSRNRAIWVFCHASEWGEYQLLTNNCESFSRYCRVGKKESRQVVGRFVEITAMLSRLLLKLPIKGSLKLPIAMIASAMEHFGAPYGTPTITTKELADLDSRTTLQTKPIFS